MIKYKSLDVYFSDGSEISVKIRDSSHIFSKIRDFILYGNYNYLQN